MDEANVIERLTKLEQKVTYLEEQTSVMNELLQKVVEIGVKLDHLTDQLKSFSTRLTEIEKQPGDKWGTVVKTVLTVGVTAVVTYFISKFTK